MSPFILALIALTNLSRHGLPVLKENAMLDRMAQTRAEEAKIDFSHDLFFYELNQSGYDYKAAAENIAKDYITPGQIEGAFMASPSHKQNILNPFYRDIGIGISGDVVVVEYGRITQHGIMNKD